VEPKTDIYFPQIIGGLHFMGTLLDKVSMENMRRLAFPYYTWQTRHLGKMTKFTGLEEVFIIFQKEWEEEDLRSARENVRDDLEELARRVLGWKKLVVIFVEDEESLAEMVKFEVGACPISGL
jgi:hypothetical protein